MKYYIYFSDVNDHFITLFYFLGQAMCTLCVIHIVFQGRNERIVHQFHFLGWPDHGVPDSPTSLVNFLHVVRSHSQPPDGAPVLVHCRQDFSNDSHDTI